MVFGVSPNWRIQEEGPTDGNGSWKSSDTTDRHAKTSRSRARGNARDVEETGGDRARRSGRKYCEAFEEGRTHSYWRSWHSSGAQARCPYRSQTPNRRANPDLGQQERPAPGPKRN